MQTATGTDGHQHLDDMIVLPVNGDTWDNATAQEVVQFLLPTDAVFVRTMQTPDIGPEDLYRSADLAATVPAGEFVDSDGGVAPPRGTLSVAYQKPDVAGCSFITGT